MANHEANWLLPFQKICEKRNLEYTIGQGNQNQLAILPNLPSVQFGDLRVRSGNETHVVEIENGGGVTNLAKYWAALAPINVCEHIERVVLTHVYNRAYGYQSHHAIWNFLYSKMDVWPRFEAHLYVVAYEELDIVARLFAERIPINQQ
ncbi:hypothetical protein HUU59_10325 [bacterium]|nr:hypothetical protein [bacterium]